MAGSGSSSLVSKVRKKIIYVDDVQYSLKSVKNKLGEIYEFYTAESAQKLFEVLAKVKPDLILLDVNMPEVDGYDVIQKLKADDRYSAIPVIFLTSSNDKESVVKGMNLGASDYVVKPFDTLKLIESIESQFEPKTSRKSTVVKSSDTDYKPNILIVDDIPSQLRTIHFALHDKYNVTLLSKPEVVVEYLQTNQTDLILLDYLMPVLNGFDLIPIIKALPGYANIPIIIISTEGSFKNVNDAIALGATDFILKPFGPKELNDKVEKYLSVKLELQREKKEIDFFLKL